MRSYCVVALVAVAAALTPVSVAAEPGSGQAPLLAVAAVGHRAGLTVMTTDGKLLPGRSIKVPSATFAVSPDGNQIAYSSGAFSVSVRPTYGAQRTAVIRHADDPAWSPDGQELAVDGYGAGAPHFTSNIFTVRPGEPKKLLFRDEHWDTDPAWSPDGTAIAFVRGSMGGGYGGPHTGIYIWDGTSLRKLVGDVQGVAFDPVWSPDGRQIAFDDTMHGKRLHGERTNDVYLVNSDGTGLHQITKDPSRDDDSPQWSPDGREIAFSVSTPGDERAAVGVEVIDSGQPACLLRPGWSGDWPVAWLPGSLPTPLPSHCAASLQPPRPEPRFGCTKAAARSAVDRSDLPLSIKQYAHRVQFGDITKRCVDFTHDGRGDLAVLFDGGGSGGVIAWAAFRRTKHDWKKVLFRTGDRLTVSVVGSNLLETYPVYRPGDCHCDPTGGVAHREYGWNGERLVLVSRWHTLT